MITIKEIQEQFGVSAENNPAEPTERISLDQIRKQVNCQLQFRHSENSVIEADKSESDEIREILEHVLGMPIRECRLNCRAFTDIDYVNYSTNLIFPIYGTLADFLVAEDWFSMQYKGEKTAYSKHKEHIYVKPLWSLFREMADNYSYFYFKKFMQIKVTSLMKFLRNKDDCCRDIPAIRWASGSEVKYKYASLGEMFEKAFPGGWDMFKCSIEAYEKNVYRACGSIQSIIHAICTAYFDVDARMEFFQKSRYNEI